MLVSFPSLFSLLSHFSPITLSHPNFFLSLSPSQPTLSPLQFFLLFLSSFSLSLVLSVPLSFCCLSLRQALHSRYHHPHCSIRIRFLHHPITLHSLRYLHTHMPLLILCSLSTPFLFTVSLVPSIHSFLLFLSFSLRLSVSLSLCISSSWVLGVAGMRRWVWLGCGGFLWIMGLYGGSWWVSAVVQ